MTHITYTPHGVCSRQIDVLIDDDGIVTDVRYFGGCSGNTQGVAKLAVGKSVDELIALLGGIRCGFKETSCPDQLARALIEYKKSKEGEA